MPCSEDTWGDTCPRRWGGEPSAAAGHTVYYTEMTQDSAICGPSEMSEKGCHKGCFRDKDQAVMLTNITPIQVVRLIRCGMCIYLFTGSFLWLVCIWRASVQRGGRMGQRVWSHSSTVGAFWPLGSQGGSHWDLPGLETHERSLSTGRTGRYWLREAVWGMEVRRPCYFLFQFSSYLSSSVQ